MVKKLRVITIRSMKLNVFAWLVSMVAVMAAAVGSAAAVDLQLNGKPIDISGYINQGVCFGVAGDHVDTQEGFQQSTFQFLFETRYQPTTDLALFASLKINTDWSYDFLNNNSDWQEKGFSKSRDDLYFFDEWEDLINEIHFTWTPGNWKFRVGKQVIQWGEADFSAITNVISPSDYRRGATDVEIESFFYPITLAKAEYYFPIDGETLTSLGMEFIFNPNLHSSMTKGVMELTAGKMGVWAPFIGMSTAGLAEFFGYDEPDRLDPEGYEYGLRLFAEAWESIFQLMFWYGRANLPLETGVDFTATRVDHFGYFPREKMVGGSFCREIPVSVSAIGGIQPIFRLEAAYFFDTELAVGLEKDQVKWAAQIDWKFKCNFLNPKTYFSLVSEFSQVKTLGLEGEDEANQIVGMLSTSYYKARIIPSIVVVHDLTNEFDNTQVVLAYEHSDWWNYQLTGTFFHGEASDGMDYFNNKDNICFTVAYRF